VWDGYAQCPCGLDGHEEDQEDQEDHAEQELIPSLSREQILKGLLLQIGFKRDLAKDILIYIFNLMKRDMVRDQESVRKLYTNCIFRETLFGSPDPHGHRFDGPIDEVDFTNRLPNGRGLEWSIKWDGVITECKVKSRRKYMLEQINILGEKNYLMEAVAMMRAQLIPHEATLRKKILYLNTSPQAEVQDDYENYENSGRVAVLLIDDFGDSLWL